MQLSGGTVTTSDGKGLRYTSDYSGTFENNSLVTKLYVDSLSAGLDPKSAVLVATTGNIPLSGLSSVDGILLYGNERVLVKDQISKATNGIYIANSGSWVRASDFNGVPNGEVSQGALIPVLSGTTNINTSWILVTKDPISLGTTELEFTKFSQLLNITNGNGIDIVTNGETKEVSVGLASGSGLNFSSGKLTVDSAIAGSGLTWGGGVINANVQPDGISGIPVRTDSSNSMVVNAQDIANTNNFITGATNGLTRTGNSIALGGILTGDTTISTNS